MRNYGWILVAAILVAGFFSVIKVVGDKDMDGKSGVQGTIDSLRTELDSTKAAFRIHKEISNSRMKELESKVGQSEAARQDIERRLKRLVIKDPLEWLRGLPASDRDKIISHINGNIAEEL